MAIVRLARLDDLDQLASAVERIALQAAAAPLPVAARAPAPPIARPALPSAAPPPTPETREKKTTDLTVEAETRAGVAEALPPLRPAGEPPVPPPLEALAQPSQTPAPPPTTLPSDPLAAWEACGEAVGGLATDFVAMAGRVAWVDDVLEASFPAEATTAVAFLSRPEMVAALNRALSEAAGRPLRHRIKQEPKAAVKPQAPRAAGAGAASGAGMAAGPGGADRGGSAPSPPAPALGRSQAALLRDTLEHPLVIQARSLFDAAIRKVEQGRARAPSVEPTQVAAVVPDSEGAALPDDEETIDHAADGDVD
jgi:hypothetical protein